MLGLASRFYTNAYTKGNFKILLVFVDTFFLVV